MPLTWASYYCKKSILPKLIYKFSVAFTTLSSQTQVGFLINLVNFLFQIYMWKNIYLCIGKSTLKKWDKKGDLSY